MKKTRDRESTVCGKATASCLKVTPIFCLLIYSAPLLAELVGDTELTPQGFREKCFRVQAGASINYRFSSNSTLKFNVHRHDSGETIYLVPKSRAKKLTGSVIAPVADKYCVFWKNPETGKVSLAYQIRIE